MNCDEEALTEYLDGELDAARKDALERHLAACRSCQALLGRLKLGSAAFRAHAFVAPRPARAVRETKGRELKTILAVLAFSVVVLILVGTAFKPQLSGVVNQIMGAISGAASTIGAGN